MSLNSTCPDSPINCKVFNKTWQQHNNTVTYLQFLKKSLPKQHMAEEGGVLVTKSTLTLFPLTLGLSLMNISVSGISEY